MSILQQTQTSKAILDNEEAVILAHRLRDVAIHVPRLALVLYQTATPALLEVLETIIGQTNEQMGTALSEEDARALDYLIATIKQLQGRGKLQDARSATVQRSVKFDGLTTRRADAIRTDLKAIDDGVGVPKRGRTDYSQDSRVLAVHAPDGGSLSRVRKLRKVGT